jgi:predicted RNA-binding Zn-ribbon protein involved in translation (DUF1610 family)
VIVEALKGILNAMRNVRYRGPEPVYCPNCRSTKIYPKANFGILPRYYQCKECGYEGFLVLEIEPEIRDNDNIEDIL